MDTTELETRLQLAEELVTRMVDANPDDPGLMAQFDSLRHSIEAKAPEHVGHIRERFQCLLGSLGLIPSDNEGEGCG